MADFFQGLTGARAGARGSVRLQSAARALPVAATLGGAILIAWHDRGSISAADFLPVAVGIALLVAAVVWSGAARRPSRATLVAGAGLAGLALWAGLSAFWAPLPSLARDEGLLVALGLLAFVVPALTLRTPGDRLLALAVVSGVLALVGIGTALSLLASTDPNDVFRYRRLSFPITYANASAGLFLAGLWPALVLAGRRAAPSWTRIAAFSTATLLLAVSLLAQSKGAILGLAVSAVVVAAVSGARLRLLAVAALAAAPVAVAFGPLTAAYRATGTAEVRDMHRAAWTVLVLACVGAGIGAAYVLADRRVEPGERARKATGRIVGGAALVAAVALIGIAAVSHPGSWLSTHWRTFKHAPAAGAGGTHLVELGSNRYDFWRVAIGEFERHPLAGDGARGFGPAYLIHGTSNETPARAHSLPLEILGEEGAIGFALAALAYGALLLGLLRRARARSAAATAALGGCVLLLAQAGADWTFTFPAVTIPFFVLAGIGLTESGRPPIAPRVARAGIALALVLALFVLAPPWLSAKLVRTGLASGSRSDLQWAHRLDPVSIDPWIAEAQSARSAEAAIAPLEQARARAPRSLAVHYLLGSVLFNAGRLAPAKREFEQALKLHPGDPAVERALAVIAKS